MFRTCLLALFVCATAVAGVTFEPNGDAILENDLIRLRLGGKPGPDQGISSWVYKPTGAEMIDVLYGQTDYVEGHVLGERFDSVQEPGLPSTGNPDVGRLYIPLEYGAAADGSGILLVQEARGQYVLRRTVILRTGMSTVEIRYKLTNVRAPRQAFALRFHSAWSPGARGRYQRKDDTIFIPTTEKVMALDQTLNNERFKEAYGPSIFFQADWAGQARRSWTGPGRVSDALAGNWAAQVNREHGDAMYFVIDEDKLQGYYNCPGITLEPCLDPVTLAPGESTSFTVYVGSLTGAKGRQVVGATPLWLVTKPLVEKDGKLSGEIVPAFTGMLLVGRAGFEAKPGQAIALENVAVTPGKWSLTASIPTQSQTGVPPTQRIGADGTVALSPVTIDFQPPERPSLWLRDVYVDEATSLGLRKGIYPQWTVVCPWDGPEELKAVARKLSRTMGYGLAWDNVGGPQIVLGSVDNQYVEDIGQLMHSVAAEWPGEGKGVIAWYASVPLTQDHLLLAAGSDDAGALKAANELYDRMAPFGKARTGFSFEPSSPDRKIYPYSRPEGKAADKIEVHLARGEYEPAQVLLTAWDELRDVEITASDLVHKETGKPLDLRRSITPYRRRLPAVWVRWVDYFPIERKDGWAGYPDPLFEQPERTIPAGESRAIWLTFFVPESATAGAYTGSVTAKVGDSEISIPIEVNVWDFTLPRDGLGGEPYMHLDAFPTTKVHDLNERQIQTLVANFVEHGMRMMHLGPSDMIRCHFSPEGAFKGKEMDWLEVSDDGCVAMDLSGFDKLVAWCDKAAEPFKLSYLVYNLKVVGDTHAFMKAFPKRHADKPTRDSHWGSNYYAEELLGLYKRHLERQGWMDRFVLKVSDEPPGYLYWRDHLAIAARSVGLPCMTAFNAIDWKEAAPHVGEVAMWQPLYMHYDPDFFAKARAAGRRISWYNCGPPPRITNSVDASELRGYIWQAAKADLDMVCWWGIQCWSYYDGDQSLWRNRYSHWNSVMYPAHPTRKPFLKKGRGWVDTAPIDSIRWEHIRDGMEDAWYVNELRRRIAAAREAGKTAASDQAQAVLDSIWETTFPTLNDYNPGYAPMMACRAKLAEAILGLE